MELKWILVLVLEASFWAMLAAFLLLRYRYRLEWVTRYFVIGVLIDTAGYVGLGIWDYVESGTVSIYTAVLVALLVYSFTLGTQHLRRLDRWMAEHVRPSRRVSG